MAGIRARRTSCAKSSKPITISSRLGSFEAGSRLSTILSRSGAAIRPRTRKNIRKRNDMPAQAQAGVPGMPDMKVSVRQLFGIDTDFEVPAYSKPDDHVPDLDNDYVFSQGGDARHPGRLQAQPPRDDPGLSRHRQVDAHRAGGRAAELALHPRQPRQPRQPHRSGRQGRDRPQGGQAGHRVPRGHSALLPADQHGAVLRRVRRRPSRRDVRDPARAGAVGQADPARPEPR